MHATDKFTPGILAWADQLRAQHDAFCDPPTSSIDDPRAQALIAYYRERNYPEPLEKRLEEFLSDEDNYITHEAFRKTQPIPMPPIQKPAWADNAHVGISIWPEVGVEFSSNPVEVAGVEMHWEQIITFVLDEHEWPDGRIEQAGMDDDEGPTLSLRFGGESIHFIDPEPSELEAIATALIEQAHVMKRAREAADGASHD